MLTIRDSTDNTTRSVLSHYENSEPCNSSVEISEPNSFPKPVSRIDASLRVGVCEPVDVSGEQSYGGGPRPLTYSWEAITQGQYRLASRGITVDEFLAEVNSESSDHWFGRPFFSLASNDTAPGTIYEFKLTVRNFIGDSAMSQVAIEKVNVSIPSVTILAGQHRDVVRSHDVLIQGTASLPNAQCLPPDAKIMKYEWRQVAGPQIALTEETRNNKDLYIPGGTLQTYHTYKMELSARPCSRRGGQGGRGGRGSTTDALLCLAEATNYAHVWIYIRPEPLVAHVVGGSRIAGTDTMLSLDGNVYDPSDVPGK